MVWSESDSRAVRSLMWSSSAKAMNLKGCKQSEVDLHLAARSSAMP
jgi:hypothetical protein